uniref:Transmembrane protein n=1 Tax=Toxoplasma gondii COUG TaxID=1074873 RepID=A0A2G8Y0T2_TOXGO|nr:hypothetical protein TGCOUG_316290 [Toxoplasma gondii COUG]
MKTTILLIDFLGVLSFWLLFVAGQGAETGRTDYVPPVPLEEAKPVTNAADGAGCCAVASDASKTQAEAEKELAKTLKNLVETRDSANTVRIKNAIAKLVTQQQAERLVSKAVEAKAKKDAEVAEAEVQALEKELAALCEAHTKSEQKAAQLDEQLLKTKEVAIEKAHKLSKSVEAELDFVKREVQQIQSALPKFRTQDAEAERKVHQATADIQLDGVAAAVKEVEAPSQVETAQLQTERAVAEEQTAETDTQGSGKSSFISVHKRKHRKHAGKLTP